MPHPVFKYTLLAVLVHYALSYPRFSPQTPHYLERFEWRDRPIVSPSLRYLSLGRTSYSNGFTHPDKLTSSLPAGRISSVVVWPGRIIGPNSSPEALFYRYGQAEEVKPVEEHIPGDLKYDFRTKTHSLRRR